MSGLPAILRPLNTVGLEVLKGGGLVAKLDKSKKEKSVEETLWDAANKLRGTVEPSEYKHVVLSLIFLKFANDKFQMRQQELIAEGKQKYLDVVDFYTMKNVFYLPLECRWDYLVKNAKQNDLAIKIDTALSTLEKNNPALKGALPDNYYSRLNLELSKLSALIDTVNNIDTVKDESHDIIGRIYEYFLRKFAITEGKGKGEFYTPKNVVNFMAELIEPYKGKIYDPCCGSGGMFVQSLKFVDAHKGNSKEIAIYGQEATRTTYKLAKMNLAIRGISANLGDTDADTFANDLHKDLKADYILANPPFNQKDWRASNELVDDPRWMGFDLPPVSNANYGWILHMVSKLSANGVGAFLLANGALGDSDTQAIRKQLIEKNLIEALFVLPRDMFYSTDISVTLWIINKNKKARKTNLNGKDVSYRDREKEVLFVDLRKCGEEYEKAYIQLQDQEVQSIVNLFHSWQRDDLCEYEDKSEFCYSASIDEIRKKNYTLVPSKYIEFKDRDFAIDYKSEMNRIQTEVVKILKSEADTRQELINAFKELGYEIEI